MSLARTAVGAGLAVLLAAGCSVERFVNRVRPVELPEVSREARLLHRSSFVADMHADSLLFGRNLLERGRVGHVDLPRLQEGGVALQIFTAVTRAPYGMNIDRTPEGHLDLLTLRGVIGLDRFAIRGPFGRAMLQAKALQRFIAGSGGALVAVRSRADLEELLRRRAEDPRVVGAVLGIEGAHALEEGPAQVDALFDEGLRVVGFTHFFDNAYAGSAHGVQKRGLTENGRRLLRRMEELGILADLAHLSPAGIEDVLALATRPVIVSHTGVRATCDNNRNLSDAQIRAIAAHGGVIGIGYWETAVCGVDPGHIVAAIRHVVDLVGDTHVGLGSDFDGATTTGFDAAALPALTQALLDAGFQGGSIRRILGGNLLRVLEETLPGR